ncbi:MAG TPA: DinB family protein [Candidatus Acidoferrales bacterium]|nr:DinB family protein [Candidatus Acidoferrales bacterium]
MRASIRVGMAVLACCLGATITSAQMGQAGGPPPMSQAPPTITSVLDTQLTIIEREVTGVAQEMPEDKYSFAPTNGEFKGVRTFAQQVKHIATVNDRFFDSILGVTAPVAPDEGIGSNGPDAVQTKDQILQYLKESFARGHKAIATINADNAVTPLKDPAVPFLRTRAALAIFACTHAMDHYGQMVEYLRDNGHIPPASQQRPPANPPAKP